MPTDYTAPPDEPEPVLELPALYRKAVEYGSLTLDEVGPALVELDKLRKRVVTLEREAKTSRARLRRMQKEQGVAS